MNNIQRMRQKLIVFCGEAASVHHETLLPFRVSCCLCGRTLWSTLREGAGLHVTANEVVDVIKQHQCEKEKT